MTTFLDELNRRRAFAIIFHPDAKRFEEFKTKLCDNLALDHHGELVYIAPSRVNLQLTQDLWPEVRFAATREHGVH